MRKPVAGGAEAATAVAEDLTDAEAQAIRDQQREKGAKRGPKPEPTIQDEWKRMGFPLNWFEEMRGAATIDKSLNLLKHWVKQFAKRHVHGVFAERVAHTLVWESGSHVEGVLWSLGYVKELERLVKETKELPH